MRLTTTFATSSEKQPKRLPRNYQDNYILCWDAEWKSLYARFLHSLKRYDSNLAATVLLAKLYRNGDGGGGFTRPIRGWRRGVPVIGQLPTNGTRGPE